MNVIAVIKGQILWYVVTRKKLLYSVQDATIIVVVGWSVQPISTIPSVAKSISMAYWLLA